MDNENIIYTQKNIIHPRLMKFCSFQENNGFEDHHVEQNKQMQTNVA